MMRKRAHTCVLRIEIINDLLTGSVNCVKQNANLALSQNANLALLSVHK